MLEADPLGEGNTGAALFLIGFVLSEAGARSKLPGADLVNKARHVVEKAVNRPRLVAGRGLFDSFLGGGGFAKVLGGPPASKMSKVECEKTGSNQPQRKLFPAAAWSSA